jgi:DNA helicase IV
VETLARSHDLAPGAVSTAAVKVWPRMTTTQVWRRLRSRRALEALDVPGDLIDAWLQAEGDGALADEVRARFEGVPARYSHVIVDEAQDLTIPQLRAVMRRADGLTLVGDDAQRRLGHGIGLRRAAELLGVRLDQMDTAYRMSAEIADWLNQWAADHDIDAVPLIGIRPTGVAVRRQSDAGRALADLQGRWSNVARITAPEVWSHKGVEYDAVVVDAAGMDAHEVYLAASRAAHELVVVDHGVRTAA